MKIRVLPGQSICYGGVWYNQGDVVEVPHNAEFNTHIAKYDQDGKYLGEEIVSQVETLEEPKPSKQKKEEG